MLQYLKQAKSALSLLNPDEVRRRAERPLVVGLVAEDSAAYAAMEDFLTPLAVSHDKRVQAMQSVHRACDPDIPEKYDLVLYEQGLPCPATAFTFFRDDPARTVEEIVRARDDLWLALARNFHPFRKPVVDRIVTSVARENAIFAVASALPNVVPNLLEIPWALGEFASDTAFITMNQVRMAFLVAAASDKQVGYNQQVAELISIAAGAFGWRHRLRGHLCVGQGARAFPRSGLRLHAAAEARRLPVGVCARQGSGERGGAEEGGVSERGYRAGSDAPGGVLRRCAD